MAEEQLAIFEVQHAYAQRWTPTMQVYKDALVLMTERRYRTAVDKLERLVVQRLLELTKLGMSGVGTYLLNTRKLINHLSNSIQDARED